MFMKSEVMYWMMLGMDEDQVQSKENVELAWTYIKKNLDFYVIQKRSEGWPVPVLWEELNSNQFSIT